MTIMTDTSRPFTDEDVERIVEATKQEILEDIAAGTVPDDVPDFSSLHDYVDANCYGGLTEREDPTIARLWEIRDESDYLDCAIIDFGNAVQNRVDAWLRARNPQ